MNMELIGLWMAAGWGASSLMFRPNPDDDAPPRPPWWRGPWPWWLTSRFIAVLGAIGGGEIYQQVFLSREIAIADSGAAFTTVGAFIGALILSDLAVVGLKQITSSNKSAQMTKDLQAQS